MVYFTGPKKVGHCSLSLHLHFTLFTQAFESILVVWWGWIGCKCSMKMYSCQVHFIFCQTFYIFVEKEELKKKNLDKKTVDVSQKENHHSKEPKKQWTHAVSEVAAINKLLGEPMTDDKALGFIKKLLLKNSPTMITGMFLLKAGLHVANFSVETELLLPDKFNNDLNKVIKTILSV